MFSCKRHRQRSAPCGFSLVEIMVAMLIGLVGILVIMQVFATFEGQKRTTTGGADAQQNGLVGLLTIEREVRIAGLGLAGLACSTINAYNANRSPQSFTLDPWPVTIRRNPGLQTDEIVVVYSTSPFGHVAGTLTAPMTDAAQPLITTNGHGFGVGDIFLISQGTKPCAIGQVSALPTQAGANWTIPHDSGGAFPYNPPAGLNNFPKDGAGNAIGYDAGAKVINLGQMINVAYLVQNNSLVMRDLNAPDSKTNPIALVNGIVALRAQYGKDEHGATATDPPDGYADKFDNEPPTSSTSVVAVRLAVVAQSEQQEKADEAPTTDGKSAMNKLVLWDSGESKGAATSDAGSGEKNDGSTIDLDAADQRFRHRVFLTTIPLRNVIWNN